MVVSGTNRNAKVSPCTMSGTMMSERPDVSVRWLSIHELPENISTPAAMNTTATEPLLVVHDLLSAIDIGGFTIRVNDRRVLAGVLAECGVADRSTQVLRALDKLGKAPGKFFRYDSATIRRVFMKSRALWDPGGAGSVKTSSPTRVRSSPS